MQDDDSSSSSSVDVPEKGNDLDNWKVYRSRKRQESMIVMRDCESPRLVANVACVFEPIDKLPK
eukprot:8273830-Prorocentrum_lima.AAC.1